MSLLWAGLLGALAVLLFAGAGLAASGARTSAGRLWALTRGAAPLTDVDGEATGLFEATVAGAGPEGRGGRFVAVTDTAGYWWLRYPASGGSTNLFALLGALGLRVVYGDAGTRSAGGRRRAGLLVPAPLAVRAAGERTALSLGEAGRPLQRLEADGGAVPFVVVAAVPALVVGALVLSVVPPGLLPAGQAAVARLPVWWLAGGGYLGFLLAVKGYHDTALVGGWDAVVAADDPGAPVAASDAAGTEHPPGTALACLRTLDADERLRVLGRVRPEEDGVELVDGVVTTRGRRFLTAAAAAGTVRGGAVALVLAAAGAGTASLAWLAL